MIFRSNWREAPIVAVDRQLGVGAIFSSPLVVGSVVYFGSLLVHASTPNRTGHDRRALLYSYQPAGRRTLRDAVFGKTDAKPARPAR